MMNLSTSACMIVLYFFLFFLSRLICCLSLFLIRVFSPVFALNFSFSLISLYMCVIMVHVLPGSFVVIRSGCDLYIPRVKFSSDTFIFSINMINCLIFICNISFNLTFTMLYFCFIAIINFPILVEW